LSDLNGYPILAKPVSVEAIERCVRECLEGSGAGHQNDIDPVT
jgi:hypothetical protein